MDFNFIYNNIGTYYDALMVTIKVSFWGIFASCIIGIIIALVQFNKIKYLSKIFSIYVEISRNTPFLIQLLFIFYGLPKFFHFSLSAFSSSVIALIFLGSSYMSESFKAALMHIDKVQIDSAKNLGFKNIDMFRYIIMPLSLSFFVPSLVANIIFLIKETSVVTVIALADIMYATNNIIANYYKTNEALFLLVISYLIILLPISIIGSFLERKFRYV